MAEMMLIFIACIYMSSSSFAFSPSSYSSLYPALSDLLELSNKAKLLASSNGKDTDPEHTKKDTHVTHGQYLSGVDWCIYNYNSPCPKGWTYIRDKKTCKAPNSYDPPDYSCDSTLDVSNFDKDDKREFMFNCKALWPCYESDSFCQHDYSSDCPYGWTIREGEDGHLECFAPDDYDGECENHKLMSHMSPKEKETFSVECYAPFPCFANDSAQEAGKQDIGCLANYTDYSCPFGWRKIIFEIKDEEGLFCQANKDNRPGFHADGTPFDCGFGDIVINMAEWSNSDKSDYAEKCDVEWPCGHATTFSQGNKTQEAKVYHEAITAILHKRHAVKLTADAAYKQISKAVADNKIQDPFTATIPGDDPNDDDPIDAVVEIVKNAVEAAEQIAEYEDEDTEYQNEVEPVDLLHVNDTEEEPEKRKEEKPKEEKHEDKDEDKKSVVEAIKKLLDDKSIHLDKDKDNSTLKDENSKLKAENKLLERLIAKIKEHEALKVAHDAKKDENNDLKKQNHELKSANKMLQSEKEKLKQKHQDYIEHLKATKEAVEYQAGIEYQGGMEYQGYQGQSFLEYQAYQGQSF